MLSKQEVLHVAKLARIALSPEDIEKFQKELSSILDWVEKLKEVDISNVEPTFHSTLIKNVMRDDVAKSKTKKDVAKLIKLMPETKDNYLKVKSVFD